jgi:hypothetical protein
MSTYYATFIVTYRKAKSLTSIQSYVNAFLYPLLSRKFKLDKIYQLNKNFYIDFW